MHIVRPVVTQLMGQGDPVRQEIYAYGHMRGGKTEDFPMIVLSEDQSRLPPPTVGLIEGK